MYKLSFILYGLYRVRLLREGSSMLRALAVVLRSSVEGVVVPLVVTLLIVVVALYLRLPISYILAYASLSYTSSTRISFSKPRKVLTLVLYS